jgi:site-specific recombinase XerD
MSALAPTVQAWFTEHLLTQRQASPRTVGAYRDTLRMLLAFAQARTGKAPSQLDVADLDAALIATFLTHLEQERHNSARTRNARLAAIRSLYRYAALRHPEHAQLIQRVLAIPGKQHDRHDVSFLQPEEVDALLAAPDRSTRIGRRDHALLVLAVQTGLRVSELTGIGSGDIQLGSGPHVRCTGKGRKGQSDALDSPHREGAARMDERARRLVNRPALRNLAWRAAQSRRCAVARRQVRRHGGEAVPVDRRQDRLASRSSPHLRDEPSSQWRRRGRYRSMAGPRK